MSEGRGAGNRMRGLILAALLTIMGVGIAWLSIRAALVRALPPASANVVAIAPHDPGTVLARASDALVRQRGILAPATLAAVRGAAAAAPLDARAYLVLGHQQLLDGEGMRAVRTLEAGQRLDPRQRLIHLLLLDRYIRTGRYSDAAGQFSVLARLMGPTQGPIATAMAAMALAPETRGAVRRTLLADPRLERGVLIALARSDTDPAAIFALATPAAIADAGSKESWGPVLITRLVERGRFAAAREIWRRIYQIPAADAAAPIFDARFAGPSASPPFDWTLVASGLGVADIRRGSLVVNYYGRESGELASQLLVLPPGRYRFTVIVDPGKPSDAARLNWTLACATGDKAELLTLPVTAGATRRRLATAFDVSANCPAQMLLLRGEASEFPTTVNLTLRRPDITKLPEKTR